MAVRDHAGDGLYEKDLVAWLHEQAALLRRRASNAIDYENIAEELEGLARNQRNALRSHWRRLVQHLLKWRFQPARRSKSWELSIVDARQEIADLLEQSPSLRQELVDAFDELYSSGRRRAAVETQLGDQVLPRACPWSIKQILAADFLPEGKE